MNHGAHWIESEKSTRLINKQLSDLWKVQGFFKENVRYPVWTCRDSILGTRFYLILETR